VVLLAEVGAFGIRSTTLTIPLVVRGVAGRPWRLPAHCLVLALLLDLLLQATGTLVVCQSCGDEASRSPLLVIGLVVWTAFLIVERRISRNGIAVLLGLLAGVHLTLVAYLLAVPRSCVTCIVACTLSLLALAGLAITSSGRCLSLALTALGSAVGVTNVVIALAF
jgi:hypothetical protein